MTEKCLFCRIARGEVPSRKAYEDDEVLAFHDINPAAPVRLLVIPKLHLDSLFMTRREHEALLGKLMGLGLILVFEELRSLMVGDDVHGVAPPDFLAGTIPLGEMMTYPVYRLFISGVCLALALGMWFVFTRTRLGMMIRAGSTNREMVQSLGIDIQFLYRVVFAVGVALAVFAGMIAAPVSSVFPGMGNQVLIICFVVVVIGGIGSVKGALVGALLIGLVDPFGKVLEYSIFGFRVLPELAGTTIYLLMAAVLLWRPEGIFGRRLQ